MRLCRRFHASRRSFSNKELKNTCAFNHCLCEAADRDAVDRARKFMLPYPPSSPSIGLFKDGRLLHMVERHHIEGRSAEMIAEHLKAAFDEFC